MTLAVGLVDFLFFVINAALKLLVIAIIANAILSWLFAFDIVNYRNRFVYQLAMALDRLTSPVLAPLRRFIPPLGGMDLTPIIALILIQGLQIYIISALYQTSMRLVAG